MSPFEGVKATFEIIHPKMVLFFIDLEQYPSLRQKPLVFAGMHEFMMGYPKIQSWTYRGLRDPDRLVIQVVGDIDMENVFMFAEQEEK